MLQAQHIKILANAYLASQLTTLNPLISFPLQQVAERLISSIFSGFDR